MSSRWSFLVIFALTVFVVAIFWGTIPSRFLLNESSDYPSFYEPVARNIWAGKGIVLANGAPAISYPPGYPLILAGVFAVSNEFSISENAAISIFTLACMGTASLFLYLVARILWGPLLGVIPVFIWITYPFSLWLTKQPNSEVPFQVVFNSCMYIFWRIITKQGAEKSLSFGLGLLLGLAALIRPIAMGVGLILAFLLWLMFDGGAGKRISLIVLLLLGNLLTILPWEAWCVARKGNLVPLSNAGPAALRDGLTFAISPRGFRKGVEVPEDVTDLMQDISSHYRDMKTIKGVILVLGAEIRLRPKSVLKLVGIKIVRSWYGTDSQRYERPIIFIQVGYLILVLLAALSAWMKGAVGKRLLLFSLSILLYFWVMNVASTTLLRYMVPTTGLLFLILPALSHTFNGQASSTNLGLVSDS